MKWNTIDELPENGSLVWVKLPGEKPIVRLFQNDSFGLGERDFEVVKWSHFRGQSLSDQECPDYKRQSIRRALDHTFRNSSEWSLNLVH